MLNNLDRDFNEYDLDRKITHYIKMYKCDEETALRAIIRPKCPPNVPPMRGQDSTRGVD
jgi:hypothetical protein